jgi:hypothetical protein
MRKKEAQRVSDMIAKRLNAIAPRVHIEHMEREGWSGRYFPGTKQNRESGSVKLQYGRGTSLATKRALLAHELAHGFTRVIYCDQTDKKKKKKCSYKGQHDKKRFYRVLRAIHKYLGTDPRVARELEKRAGYHPPRHYML